MGPYGPRDALRDHVVSLGCSIRRSPDGGGLNVDCPSHEARIALLDDLAWHDARYDGRIAKLAMAIASKVKPDAKGKVDELALAKALHHAVSTRVRYLGEGSERFSKAWDTWQLGVGDCDDSARLLLALARSVGMRARLAVLAVRDPETGGVAPNHATVALGVRGRFYWAEPSLRGVRFGEEPRAGAKRLRAERSDLGSDLGAVGGMSPSVAFSILRSVWPTELLAPTPFAVHYAAAWSKVDGAWGRDPKIGPFNWGAVHCPTQTTPCAPGCVEHVDHYADQREYRVCFKAYGNDEEGAADFLRHLVKLRPLTRAALARGLSTRDVAAAMRRENYYGGFCREAAKAGAKQNDPACVEEAIDTAVIGLRRASAQNAAATGEADALAAADASGPAALEGVPRWKLALLVGGLATAGGLAYAYRRELGL